MMEGALVKQRAGVVQKQVAAGREFKASGKLVGEWFVVFLICSPIQQLVVIVFYRDVRSTVNQKLLYLR